MKLAATVVALLATILPLHARSSKTGSARNDVAQFQSAIHGYKMEYGRYPSQDVGLAPLIETEPSDTNPLGIVYYEGRLVDPWGNPYQYRNPGTHSGKDFDIYSFGPDGLSRSNGNDPDDIAPWKPLPRFTAEQVRDIAIFCGALLLLGAALVAMIWMGKRISATKDA